MPAFNLSRTKVQLKLAVERTKMLQHKKEAIAKKDRRDIANLVERGKLETARIKTEGIIAEDIHIELLEILELYCETLLARFALLDLLGKEPEPAIAEACAAIIHAAPRVELRELHVLREMLISRYGREYSEAVTENKGGSVVSTRITSRMAAQTPGEELVDMYISEICKAYDVPFTSPHLKKEEAEAAEVEQETSSIPQPASIPVIDPKAAAATQSDAQQNVELGNAVAKDGSKSGGEPNKTLASKKATEEAEAAKKKDEEKGANGGGGGGGGSAYNDLEARFAALKRK